MVRFLTDIACIWIIIGGIWVSRMPKKTFDASKPYKLFNLLIAIYSIIFLADQLIIKSKITDSNISVLVLFTFIAINLTWNIVLIKKSKKQ